MNRCVLTLVAGTMLALAAPALAVPPAQPNGTVPSVKKKSEPAGSAKDAKGHKAMKSALCDGKTSSKMAMSGASKKAAPCMHPAHAPKTHM